MIIGWLFPDRERCGIAIYSRNYCAALHNHCQIIPINSDCLLRGDKCCYEQLKKCNIVHIQYETSFFFKKGSDYYFQIIKQLQKPVIVSLHEVYETFPGVFPRDKIRDDTLLSHAKLLWYDYRHPIQTAYRNHLQTGFRASQLLVHHNFHKAILETKVPSSCPIIIHPMPVYQDTYGPLSEKTDTLHLGTAGFINPEYDYDLLFKVLEKLKTKWQFTWIGGTRTEEHQSLLNNINKEVLSRNWSERFRITGWVSQEAQSMLLSKIGIYMALFKNRSSSASIARALGARKLIIATNQPVVSEINATFNSNVIRVAQPFSDVVIQTIELMSNDTIEISRQYQAIDQYVKKYNFDTMALSLIDIYKTL